MIRFHHLSGSSKGSTSSSSKTTVRVGRGDDCDVRFDGAVDRKVSSQHAEFRYEDGCWYVIDIGSTNGTLIDGERITKARLRQGEEVQLGSGGPIVRVEFDAADGAGGSMRTEVVNVKDLRLPPRKPTTKAPTPSRIDQTQQLQAMRSDLKESADTQTAKLAELAARKVAEERRKAGAQSSGQTMQIMASTLRQVQQSTKSNTRKRWVKVVAAVGGAALVVVAVLSVVIWRQQQQLAQLLKEKDRIDWEIAALQDQMQQEEDPEHLAALEEKLAALTGKVEKTIEAVGKNDKTKAAEVANGGDELDRQIRAILRKFDAQTYAVPPIFKDALKSQIDVLAQSSNLRFVHRRKLRYWPMILREFAALGLPEEMAYIAWAETQFDPKAKSAAGAVGMWQMTASTARNYGLVVDGKVDERLDPEKQTRAAAKHLANLLAEYGSDSFMLAMASYNRGEAGVRRVLHQIAQEPGGFRKEKRDFWHLYRLKKLPEETREYVPKVLAAAIVSSDPKKYGLQAAASAPASASASAQEEDD